MTARRVYVIMAHGRCAAVFAREDDAVEYFKRQYECT
jgi:hypothetical protein